MRLTVTDSRTNFLPGSLYPSSELQCPRLSEESEKESRDEATQRVDLDDGTVGQGECFR